MPKVKAVLFDLFNTLVDEFDVGPDLQGTIATKLGIDRSKFASLYGSYRPERMAGRITWAQSVERIAQDCGVSMDPRFLDRLVGIRERTFRDLLLGAESDILKSLESVRAGGFKTALVSNTDGSEVGDFWESPLGSHFDAAIFSHEVGDPKPSPTMFRVACAAIEVSPNECLFIGDGGNGELRTAATLGIRPLCAAWYLRRHFSESDHLVKERSEGFPVLQSPDRIGEYLRMYD